MSILTMIEESQLYQSDTLYGGLLCVVLKVDESSDTAKIQALENHPSDENKSVCSVGDKSWVDLSDLTPV